MGLEYHYVLPPTGAADNQIVREMFDDVKLYVDNLAPAGSGVTSVIAGTGIAVSSATGNVTISNVGVTAIAGTTHQITVSASTGSVTLSLPQNIHTSADVQFNSLQLAAGTISSNALFFQNGAATSGFYLDTFGGLHLQSIGTDVVAFDPSLVVFTSNVSFPHIFATNVNLHNSGDLTLSVAGTAGYTLQFPGTDGTNGYVLRTNGSGTLSWDSASKIDLSNLATTTAINHSLAPGTPDTISIGNSTFRWDSGHFSGGLFLYTDSPHTWFTVITSANGMTGPVNFILPIDEGSSNQVLTTDGTGNLFWGTGAAGGAATVALDNLVSVAINTSLIDDSHNVDDLGSSSKAWRTLYLKTSLKIQETGAGTNYITIQAPSSLSAAYTLTLPVDDGNANDILQTNGSGVLSWVATPAGSANTALSNLSSLAVNTSLLPGITNSINLGSYSKSWASVYIGNSLILIDPSNSSTGNTVTFSAAAGTDAIVYTLPPDDGTADYVLKTNGGGVLTWVSVASISGAASRALDNLASVAINTSLLPGTDNSIDLGSSSKDFRSLYISTSIKNGSTTLATAAELGYLTGVTSAIQTQLGTKATDSLVVHLAGTESITGAKTFSSDVVSISVSSTAFLAQASRSGGVMGLLVENTSNTSSSSALLQAKVAGTSADDPYMLFNINGSTQWTIGSDNSDSDKFKISQSAGLGTSDVFTVTTAGNVNKPLQACFLALASTDQTNATGSTNADVTVVFGSESYDIGGNFASNTFTAPVTGKYAFWAQIRVSGLTAAMKTHIWKIKTTARQYDMTCAMTPTITGSLAGVYTYLISCFADMTAGDTAFVTLNIIDGASDAVTIVSATSVARTYFAGTLIN